MPHGKAGGHSHIESIAEHLGVSPRRDVGGHGKVKKTWIHEPLSARVFVGDREVGKSNPVKYVHSFAKEGKDVPVARLEFPYGKGGPTHYYIIDKVERAEGGAIVTVAGIDGQNRRQFLLRRKR